MPDTDKSVTNGAAVATTKKTPSETATDVIQRYRPKASTTKVQDEVLRSLASVVTEAFDNARSFVALADHYDHEAGTAIRHGHLVDAAECADIGMTHLYQLKAAMNHRLRTEDERHLGEPQF